MEETPTEILAADGSKRRRLHVAMVIQRFRPYFSGQGIQLEELSRVLVRRGLDVSVIAAIRGADAPSEEQSGGIAIHRLRSDLVRGDTPIGRRLWSPTFAARTLVRLLNSRKSIDLVHVHGANDALYAAWLFGRLCRVPVVFEMTLMGVDDPATIRSSPNRFTGVRYGIFRRFPGYVAMSPALERAYHKAGLPADRLRMIPQGVDVARFRPADDRAAARRDLGALPDEPILAFVGSLVERKGIDVLLSAWEEIHRARPSARLWLIGRDRFEDDAEAERFLARVLAACSPSALARIQRFGVRDEPERFLQAADVFLFPSRREGFGTAIIEAMACGVPCVVAQLEGITDYVFEAANGRDSADGFVVPHGDAAALASATLALLADPAKAAAVGATARRRARERFAIERIAEEYLDWYAELRRRAGSAR